jgi:hypothetical protein
VLGAEVGAGQVGVDDRLPVIEREVDKRLADDDPGIVDQGIDPPPPASGSISAIITDMPASTSRTFARSVQSCDHAPGCGMPARLAGEERDAAAGADIGAE